MKILQQLLAPYPVEQFLTDHWTQKAIHISTNDSQKFHPFFSWGALNHLLNYHKLSGSDLRFSKEGKSLPDTRNPREWSDRLRQGATLIIDGVHHRVPSVAKLAAHLREDIGYETHVNLYCSPAEQRGFDCHYDTHDVLILQVAGEKKWFVYRETVLYPTSEMPSSKQNQPTEPPYLECLLKPGDLLYIPRGHWHYAIASEQSSLHLTVGIEGQTGLDWLGWLMRDLQNNADWRQNLPMIVDDQTISLQQQLETLRQHLIETLNQPDILSKYIDKLSYHSYPPLPVNLPAQMGNDIFPDLLMTRFAWSPLHRIRVKQLGERHYQVHIGSKQVDLKGIPEILVENLFNQNEFSLFDIADWTPDLDLEADLAPLLKSLVLEGVLQVVTDCDLASAAIL
ncbi:MAG: transcription factor jumonji jmjC domain-containing protein [Leptolyngbyaceae cyanobacterium CSU_1_3]|nr:transcription factor jumonji jmjC domain-containing protein [Leptolyngbyaceae cyanobacterium CSU_1_3]